MKHIENNLSHQDKDVELLKWSSPFQTDLSRVQAQAAPGGQRVARAHSSRLTHTTVGLSAPNHRTEGLDSFGGLQDYAGQFQGSSSKKRKQFET